MCLIVQGIWHVKHCGCCSCLSIKECVSLLWPIRNRVIVTCSFRDFRKAGCYSPKKGLTWNSLLLVFLFQCCCHFLWRKLFIFGFRSVYGMLYLSGVKSKADFAATSALWFPLTPMWLGIQQKTISLFNVECSLQSSLIISGCSSFLLFNHNKTESESENMVNFLCFSFEIMSRAKSMVQASAVKIEPSIGRAFVFIILFKTAAHAVSL